MSAEKLKAEIQTSGAGPETTVPHDEFVTKKELSARLKVTQRTIENWQRAGYLPYIKISSVVLFHYPEIVAHLNANFKVCRRGVARPRS